MQKRVPPGEMRLRQHCPDNLAPQKKAAPRGAALAELRAITPMIRQLGDLALQAEGREAKGEKSRRRGFRNSLPAAANGRCIG